MDRISWVSNLSKIVSKIQGFCLITGVIGKPIEETHINQFIDTLYDAFNNKEAPIGFYDSITTALLNMTKEGSFNIVGDPANFYNSLFSLEGMTKEEFREKVINTPYCKRNFIENLDKQEQLDKDISTSKNDVDDWGELSKRIGEDQDSDKVFGINEEEAYQSLLKHKTILLYGPPGTGKSTLARRLASRLSKSEHILNCTFDSTTDYGDIIVGQSVKDGNIIIIDGSYMRACKLAKEHPNSKVTIIFEEISRGNASGIFGELIPSIENRGVVYNTKYNKTICTLPNLYIIATMNDIDSSVTDIDRALIERLNKVFMQPQYGNLEFIEYIIARSKTTNKDSINIIKIIDKYLSQVNNTIRRNDKSLQLGTRLISNGILKSMIIQNIEDQVEEPLYKIIQSFNQSDINEIKYNIKQMKKEIQDILDNPTDTSDETKHSVNADPSKEISTTLNFTSEAFNIPRVIQEAVDKICKEDIQIDESKSYKDIFYMKGYDYEAKGILHKDFSFTVLKGGQVKVGLRDSASTSARRIREEYKNKLDENWVILEDITFKTASGAGMFVYGGTNNGNISWKTIHGQSLGSYKEDIEEMEQKRKEKEKKAQTNQPSYTQAITPDFYNQGFFFKGTGTKHTFDARGVLLKDGRFVLMEGSKISAELMQTSDENIIKYINKLRQDHSSRVNIDFTTKERIIFESPARAASFVYGGNCVNDDWKTQTGETLTDYTKRNNIQI